MQDIKLFERDLTLAASTKFGDINNEQLITVARQLHSLEKKLVSFMQHKDFSKLENLVHNAKISLASEMRKRGIPLASLFQVQTVAESMRNIMNILS